MKRHPRAAVIPNHERPLGRVLAEAHGVPFHPLTDLEAAKADSDGVVILQGDYGGQVYVVAPARLVACSATVLANLLAELDRLAWAHAEADSRGLFFESIPVGTPVASGMGGATVPEDIWVHREFGRVLARRIREVISGERQSVK